MFMLVGKFTFGRGISKRRFDSGCMVWAVMNIKSLWKRIRSAFLWATPNDLAESEKKMNAALQALTDKVAQVKTVADSAVALIGGLSQQIKDAGTDPVALQALTDSLDGSQAELAAAVTANTPAPAAPAGT